METPPVSAGWLLCSIHAVTYRCFDCRKDQETISSQDFAIWSTTPWQNRTSPIALESL